MPTLKFAVIGFPVQHSRSPGMQLAGFAAAGIDASYERVEVAPGTLPETVARFRAEGYRGWNITVPYKHAIIPLLDEVAGPEARAAHSVNTVVNQGGRLLGYSTDGYGVEQALRHGLGLAAQPPRQLYLGAGGAACAAAVYAARHGAAAIAIANRTLARAEELAALVRKAAPACAVSVLPLADTPEMRDALQAADIVFQCTSLGLHPGDPMPVPAEHIPPRVPIFDFVYTPSAFKDALRRQGNPVGDGLDMLLYQGCRSFELWTGLPAPVEAMRNGLLQSGNA